MTGPTRRQFLVGVLAAGALTACGSGEDGPSAAENDGSSGGDDAVALGVVPAMVPGSIGDPSVPDPWR